MWEEGGGGAALGQLCTSVTTETRLKAPPPSTWPSVSVMVGVLPGACCCAGSVPHPRKRTQHVSQHLTDRPLPMMSCTSLSTVQQVPKAFAAAMRLHSDRQSNLISFRLKQEYIYSAS